MPRFAANLSMLFADQPLSARFAAAAKAGFRAVEVQFPYELPAATLRGLLDTHGLQMVLHNLPAGDWAGGERGIACHPDRVAEFRQGVQTALAYATSLGVRQLNVIAGIRPDGVSQADAQRTLVDNLRHAAAELAEQGCKLLLEPINTFDVPGFFVSRIDHALAVLDEVGAPNAFLQFDLYHAQRTQGELGATLQRLLVPHRPRVAHVQVADNPGRHEPGTGEINYRYLFNLLDELGYEGWVGCEYKPRAPAGDLPGSATLAGLGWVAAHGQAL